MTFYQEGTISHEDGFGEVKVTVIITSQYENLVKPYADIVGSVSSVQCIQIGKIKKSLSNSNGEQITDQMEFIINQAAFGAVESTEPIFADNQNCLFFCMQAEDTKIRRYIAVHIGTPALSNMIFHGSINTNIPGEDVKHYGGLYTPDKYPIRDYSFTAKSYDASILKTCSFRSDVYNTLGARVDNIRERLSVNDWQEMKALFGTKFSFISTSKNWLRNVNVKHLVYFTIGNLGRVLQLILDKASEMIYDLEGINISFVVEESDLGFQTLPAVYRLVEEAQLLDPADKEKITEAFFHGDILSVGQDTDRATRVVIYPGNPLDPPTTLYSGTSPDLWSAAYIDPSAVDEVMYIHEVLKEGHSELEPPDDLGCLPDWSLNPINKSGQAKMNVLTNYGDVMTMLSELALTFACNVSISLTGVGVYSVKILNKQQIVSEEIFLRGIKSGNINISSQLADQANNYFSRVNDYLIDGHDTFGMRWVVNADLGSQNYALDTGDPNYIKGSVRVSEQQEELTSLERNYSVKSKQLMFTVNSGIINIRTKIANLNERWWDDYYKQFGKSDWRTDVEANGLWHNEPLNAQRGLDISEQNPPDFDYNEFIHPVLFNNGLFIVSEIDSEKEPRIAELVAEYSGPTSVIRPANKVYINTDGTDVSFDTLGDYVNSVCGRDVQFFETEYEMEIPFLNGFSLSETGADPSYKNLKLGSKISVNEIIRDIIAEWEVLSSEKAYAVQSIEIDVWKLTTRINMQRISKYGFTSIVWPISAITATEQPQKAMQTFNDLTITSAICQDTVGKGAAIKLRSDGYAVKALPDSRQEVSLLALP